jgi:hypothetical protein
MKLQASNITGIPKIKTTILVRLIRQSFPLFIDSGAPSFIVGRSLPEVMYQMSWRLEINGFHSQIR